MTEVELARADNYGPASPDMAFLTVQHPDEIVANLALSTAEKREILASWASDERAVIRDSAILPKYAPGSWEFELWLPASSTRAQDPRRDNHFDIFCKVPCTASWTSRTASTAYRLPSSLTSSANRPTSSFSRFVPGNKAPNRRPAANPATATMTGFSSTRDAIEGPDRVILREGQLDFFRALRCLPLP